jgi:hypothetical protein
MMLCRLVNGEHLLLLRFFNAYKLPLGAVQKINFPLNVASFKRISVCNHAFTYETQK